MRHRCCLTLALALVAAWSASEANASGYTASTPLVHGNLAVYPVRGAAPGGATPLTLDAAMARGQARIHEVAGNRHAIDNLSDRHLFIQAGDLVRGGSQDQVAATSLLVPPGVKSFPITLFCVERDRSAPLAGHSTDFSAAGLIPWQTAKLSLLTDAQATPTTEVLRRIGIWLSVESLASTLSRNIGAAVRSPISPSSLPRALEGSGVRNALEPHVDALRGLADGASNVIGAAVAINGTVYGAEIYASNELFREMWPRLLRAFATQAIALQGAQPAAPPPVRDVTAFITNAESGQNGGALLSVFRQPGGDWIYKSYVAKGDQAATELEAAVLRAIETNWSIPVPKVYLGTTNPRRYHEAVLLQALTGLVADRDAAIAQARRAGLPVDPQQLLRDNAMQPSAMAQGSASADRGSPWLTILLAVVGFTMATLVRRRSIRALRPVNVVAPAAPLPPLRAHVESRRPRRPSQSWTMSDWIGAIPPASVPAFPRQKVAEPPTVGAANAKSGRRAADLVPV